MRALIDTHVVSRSRKGQVEVPKGDWYVSSVVLQELFLMQLEDGYRYGVPKLRSNLPLAESRTIFRRSSEHAKKRPVPASVDKIVLDFRGDYASRFELGHGTVARVFNERQRDVLRGCCTVLPKIERRIVVAEYDYLVSRGAVALPLDLKAAQTALTLLGDFLASGRSPKSNMRNTLNDMFLLAQSRHCQMPLVSDDRVLSDFGHEAGCGISAAGHLYMIDAAQIPKVPKRPNRESKGYINTRWRATTS